MATSHSYGRSLFFSGTPTPQLIFTQNGLIDVDSCKDVPFAVKFITFQTRNPQTPKTGQFWQIFGLRKFRPKIAHYKIFISK